jgi:hypothetical protein
VAIRFFIEGATRDSKSKFCFFALNSNGNSVSSAAVFATLLFILWFLRDASTDNGDNSLILFITVPIFLAMPTVISGTGQSRGEFQLELVV